MTNVNPLLETPICESILPVIGGKRQASGSRIGLANLARTDTGMPRRGAALIIAIVAILIIGGTSASFLILAINLNQETERRKARINALMLAESGIKAEVKAMNDMAAAVLDGSGSWTIVDAEIHTQAFAWGSYSVTFDSVAGTDDWRLISTGTSSAAGALGNIERTVEVLAKARYIDDPGPFARALMVNADDLDAEFFDPIMTDSYTGAYSPSAPAAPFTTPYQGSAGGIASNRNIIFNDSATEIHGTVEPGVGGTVTPAGQLEMGYEPEAEEAFDNPPVDATTLVDVEATNDNAELIGMTDSFGTPYYDEAFQELSVFDGTVQLGDPSGTPKTYYFTNIFAAGGQIEFVGPTAIYLNGDMYNFGGDDLISSTEPKNVFIYSIGQSIILDAALGFGCSLYAPGAHVDFNGQGELFGSYVVRSFMRLGAMTIHYDESLGIIGASVGTDIEAFDINGWYEH